MNNFQQHLRKRSIVETATSSQNKKGFFPLIRKRFESALSAAKYRTDETSDIILFRPQTPNNRTLTWVPFTSDFDLQRIRVKWKEAVELRRKGNLSKVKDLCEWCIIRLKKFNYTIREKKESKEVSELLVYFNMLLGDVYLAQDDWQNARIHYDISTQTNPARSLKMSLMFGDRYLQLGHLLLLKGQKPQSIKLFENAEKFKPSLDRESNVVLARHWASLKRTDGKSVQKYLQCLKPDEWLKGAFVSLIYEGCKIDSVPVHEGQEVLSRIRFNQRIITFHPKLEWPYRNLGRGFLVLGEYKKAAENFEKARGCMVVSDALKFRDYSLWIGKNEYLAGDFQKSALEYARLANKLSDDHELFCGLAMAHLFFDHRSGETSIPSLVTISIEGIEQHLANAEKLGYSNTEAHYFRGRVKTLQGHKQEAINYLEAASGADPYNPQYLIHLAEVLTERRNPSDLDTAKKLLKKAHILLNNQKKETDAEVMSSLAELYQREGNSDEAEIWIKRATIACPNNSWVLLKSAWKHLVAEEYSEAHRKAERIVSTKNRIQGEKCFILGRCSMRMNKPFPEARVILSKAIGLGMVQWEAYYWLGICFAHEKNFKSATEYLWKSLQKGCNEKARVVAQMGNVFFLQGVMDKAVSCFDKAKLFMEKSQLHTGNRFYHDTMFGLAKAYSATGDYEKAINLFVELLRLDSFNDAANYSLALLYERTDDLIKCEAYLRQVLKAHKAGSVVKSSFLPTAFAKLGVLLVRKAVSGQAHPNNTQFRDLCEEAEKMLHEAHHLGLQDDIHIFYLGLLEILTGRIEQGLGRWDSLKKNSKMGRELDINLEKVNYLLGIQHVEKGNFETAIRVFESAAGEYLEEWRAEAHFRWGMEFMKKKDWKRATELIDKAIVIRKQCDIYHVGKGVCLMLSGNDASGVATACFLQALQINSQSAPALFLLGLCMYLQGEEKREEAISAFKRLIDLAYADEKLTDIAKTLVICEEMRSGRHESVENLVDMLKKETVLSKVPFLGKDFNILLAHGLIQHYDGTSARLIEELSDNAPEGAFEYSLALVHSLKGTHEKALQYFDSLYRGNGSDQNIATQYAGMLCYSAAVNIKKDRVEESLKALQRAIDVLVSVGLK